MNPDGCGDPSALVSAAEQAVFELRIDDAEAGLRSSEAAFRCAVVDRDTLARFFLIEGALALHAGDRDAAALRFRVARDLDPAGPDPSYGSKVRAAFDGTGRSPIDASIDLSPPPVTDDVRIDAALVTVPLSVPAGLHLVQVGPAGAVAFGEIVLVESGGRLVVATHRVEGAPAVADTPLPAPLPAAPVTPPPRRSVSVALLVVSGAAAGLGGVSAALAAREHGAIPEADTLRQVDAAWSRQRAFGWTAYGLWGGAVVVAGLSVL